MAVAIFFHEKHFISWTHWEGNNDCDIQTYSKQYVYSLVFSDNKIFAKITCWGT